MIRTDRPQRTTRTLLPCPTPGQLCRLLAWRKRHRAAALRRQGTHPTGAALVAGQLCQCLAAQTSSTDALPSSVQKRGRAQGLEGAEQSEEDTRAAVRLCQIFNRQMIQNQHFS